MTKEEPCDPPTKNLKWRVAYFSFMVALVYLHFEKREMPFAILSAGAAAWVLLCLRRKGELK